MANKSRSRIREKQTAYPARPDQRSDPKPKSKLARQLAKLTPPLGGTSSASPSPGTTRTHSSSSLHQPATGCDPDGALYAYDTQKAMAFADAPDVARIEAQPFLKWAGGKAQLLQQFDKFFPAAMDRYIEPFLGGGAVFFHLKRRFPHLRAFLRDNNAELINAYRAVQLFPHELMSALDEHLAAYNADRERYFYLIRSQHHPSPHLNPLPRRGEETGSRSPLPRAGEGQGEGSAVIIERAARFIFLNKTCFNGLWRVNARGEFNVPIGSHKNPALYDRDNLLAANWALRDAHLAVQDFRDTLNETRKSDFVYIDPPYYPLSATASFTSYTKEDFGGPEQEELAALFADAAQRGVRLMLSNSDTPFIRKLYRDFTMKTVHARRAINCNGASRGKVNELVVTNY